MLEHTVGVRSILSGTELFMTLIIGILFRISYLVLWISDLLLNYSYVLVVFVRIGSIHSIPSH